MPAPVCGRALPMSPSDERTPWSVTWILITCFERNQRSSCRESERHRRAKAHSGRCRFAHTHPFPQTHASIYTILCPGVCCKMCFLPGAAAQQSVKGAHWATANSGFLEHTFTCLDHSAPSEPGVPQHSHQEGSAGVVEALSPGGCDLWTGHSQNPSNSTAHGSEGAPQPAAISMRLCA